MQQPYEAEGLLVGLLVPYEDNHVICAVKPQGMLSQADATGAQDMLSVLRARIKAERGKPGDAFVGLVHRLDRPVGGIMVFAKTSKAASRLSAQIRERRFEKTYRAVVEGRPSPGSGRIEHIITKPAAGGRVRVSEAPQNAMTQKGWAALEYRVLATNPAANKSLIEVKLITGRPHQIRAQFAHIGHPVSGDRKYGAPQAQRAQQASQATQATQASQAPQATQTQWMQRAPQETQATQAAQAPGMRQIARPGDGAAQPEQWPALWAVEIAFERTVGSGRIVVQSPPPSCYPWDLFYEQQVD